MSKLSFSIALNMATSQFKQGAEYVKNSLRQIQYQVLGMASALGLGGIGLSNLASRFIDVARETTRARVALRNISGDAAGFKKNMDFLVGTSSKYGQELNGMTQEFFKFSAAATSAGISLQDQHTIYESFTRSIAAFGMSSADAHLSYLALSQMMSKGKVSSEELRRQLGERMPIAMEAMARAVGVTIQQLDGLLKAGKLVSKDVMLPFVKEMEKMLPEVNVDNIETSINRLKNSFIKLTEDLKVGEFYKKIVDGAVKMLSTIQTSFVRVATAIISGWLGGKLFGAFVKLTQDVKKQNELLAANKIKTEEQAQLATTKRIAAEKYHNEMAVLYSKASDDEKLRSYAKMTTAKKALDKSINVEKAALLAQQEAIEKFAAMNSQGVWTMAWTKIGTFVKGMLISIRGIMSTILPMAIIGLLTNFVMKMVEARKEAQRIKNIFSDNANKMFEVDNTEINKLQSLNRIVSERLGTEEEIKAAKSELIRMLGFEEGKHIDINKEVAKRIQLLREAARAELAGQENARFESRNREIARGLSKSGDTIAVKQFMDEYNRLKTERGGDLRGASVIELGKRFGLETKDIKNLTEEMVQNFRAIAYNNKILEDAIRSGIGLSTGTIPTTAISEDKPKKEKKTKEAKEELTEIQKIEKEFAEKMREIDNLRSLNLISEKEHQAETLKISEETSNKIGALYGEAAKQNELYLATRKHVEGSKLSLPEMKGRDTTFDYKKTDLEKLREQKSILEDYLKGFDADEMKKYTVEALEEIRKKEEELLSLSDALKLAELKQDIEELNKDLFSESVDGITGFANALDRVANSWERVASQDISGFERMVAIINALGDTIGAVVDAWESYKAIQSLLTQLEGARQAQLTSTAATETAAIAAVTEAKIAADIAEATSTATKSAAVVTALTAQEVAARGVMAAESTAAYAYIPFAGAALAAGQIAAMSTLISAAKVASAIPGFSDGGIYGGGSFSGDKMLARVNSGEMILNKAQQSNLFKMLDSSIGNGNGKGFSGEIKLRLEGKDAVAIINQQSLLKSRI